MCLSPGGSASNMFRIAHFRPNAVSFLRTSHGGFPWAKFFAWVGGGEQISNRSKYASHTGIFKPAGFPLGAYRILAGSSGRFREKLFWLLPGLCGNSGPFRAKAFVKECNKVMLSGRHSPFQAPSACQAMLIHLVKLLGIGRS